uniref:Interleukin 17 receptor E n=1 Tax=Latimeria chalumnae TaxID=7897 RepID=H3A1T7_LATCH
GPVFNYTLIPEEKAIQVSVLPGPEVRTRLCYQQALVCEQLTNQSYHLINTSFSLKAHLPYEYLVPCLCVEVYYLHHDSTRRRICPFREALDAYGSDLWLSSRFYDRSGSLQDQMAMEFKPLCPVKPSASLCWKSSTPHGSCADIINSSAVENEAGLCLFLLELNSQSGFSFLFFFLLNLLCPDTEWSVSIQPEFFHLLLQFSTRIPASFSAVHCSRERDQCDITHPEYTVKLPEASGWKELEMVVPGQSIGYCVQVWRSDVLFSGKHLICPDYSSGRVGLVILGFTLGAIITAALILLTYQCLRKVFKAPVWSRTVLLIYSPGSEEHQALICAFADFLRTELGSDVILDLWDVGKVAQIGIIPWLYSKKERVERERGKILLVWTRGSRAIVAMASLQKDLQQEGRCQDYALVYFEGLCRKKDIPETFAALPKFKLLKDFSSLVNELGVVADAPCWIKAATKFLVRRIIRSEKSKELRNLVGLCRLLQEEG